MTQISGTRVSTAPVTLGDGTRGLIRLVSTSNPFYALSAMLVIVGLWVSFGAQVRASETWALMVGMSGYTLLLAVTACLLVRFVGVWDDVRTVMLLVVLMFLATSVTFDEVLARDPSRGIAGYLGGLAFAVAISEGMLRGIDLKLPALFRGPYYLVLALFYLYPVALTPLLDRPRSEALSWAMFGFTPIAGLAALTLLPAIRRGRGYVRDNGSPWRWAWYPWTLFGVLAFGVLARSALLCWSMHHLRSAEREPYLFGPYFLVPFLMAVAVLLLEIGLVERKRGVIASALGMPAVLVVLSMVGHRPDPVFQEFLGHFIRRLGGTPLYLTVMASSAFFAYAAVRRVSMATEFLTGTLALLAFVGPGTIDLGELTSPRPAPILAIAALQLGLGLWRRQTWRCLIGVGGVITALMIAMPGQGGSLPQGPVAYHLVMVAVLALGAAFDDALGRFLRSAGAGMVLIGCVGLMMTRMNFPALLPVWAVLAYPLVLSALLAGYGGWLRHRPSLVIAVLILAGWLGAFAWRGYAVLRMSVSGLDYIAVGMGLFALAVLTSMAKGGVGPWRVAACGEKGGTEWSE